MLLVQQPPFEDPLPPAVPINVAPFGVALHGTECTVFECTPTQAADEEKQGAECADSVGESS